MPKFKNIPGAGKAVPTHVFVEEQVHGLSFHITEHMGESAIGTEAKKPHRHPFYEILYVTRANGRHFVDCECYQDISDTVFLLRPGQMHYWENVDEISGRLIYFGEEFFLESSHQVNTTWETGLFEEMSRGGHQAIRLTPRSKKELDRLLDMMMLEYGEKKPEYTEVLRSYLNAFLIKLYRLCRQQLVERAAGQDTLSNAFQKLLSHNLTEHQPMQYFADALGVSVNYLTDQVKKQTGLTPSELRRRAVVMEAKRLLANTNMTVNEIADYLGFMDNAYFCRVFKKQTGVPPGRFRQRCLARTTEE